MNSSIKKAKYAIVHGGPAYLDDFLCASLALAQGKRVYRRNPSLEELEDPRVLVMDVGGRYEKEKLNFDHHQFNRDAPPQCAFSLLCEYLGVDRGMSYFPWYETLKQMDSKGPFQTAKSLGCDASVIQALNSPVQAALLRTFSESPEIEGSNNLEWDFIPSMMQFIGESILMAAHQMEQSVDSWHGKGYLALVAGESCVWGFVHNESDLTGLNEYLRDKDVAFTVGPDPRGDGLKLFRLNDNPRLDFSRLEGLEGVEFAHKGGFVATLKKGTEWDPMVHKAIIPK